jgi:hypothetical protein
MDKYTAYNEAVYLRCYFVVAQAADSAANNINGRKSISLFDELIKIVSLQNAILII